MLLLVKSWYTIVMKTNTLPGAYIVYSSCTQTGSRSLEELNLSEESEYKSSIPAAGCVVNGGGDQTHSTPRSSRGPRSSHTRDQEVRRRLYMRSIVLKPLDITRGGGKGYSSSSMAVVSYDHRPSHPYNAGTDHVGFSPTRKNTTRRGGGGRERTEPARGMYNMM